MKKICMMVLSAVCVILCGCNFSGGDSSMSTKKKIAVLHALDKVQYRNVTMNNVNARYLDREDFSSLVSGKYVNGESYIEIDMERGRCHVYTENCPNAAYKGEKFESDFVYTVKAAGENCIYLCPLSLNKTGYSHNDRFVDAVEGKPFALYLPFYGYGENRLEVSSIMNGEICMPSGTYWKSSL